LSISAALKTMTFAERVQQRVLGCAALSVIACAHQTPVERLVDGRVVRGPAISEVAYAAYLEGSIAQAEGKAAKAQEAFAFAESEDEALRDWNQHAALNAAMAHAPSLSVPTRASAIALAIANPTAPGGWLKVLQTGTPQEQAWAGCELAHRWPRLANSLDPLALRLVKDLHANEARMLALCIAARGSDPTVKALAIDEALYAYADLSSAPARERVFDVAAHLKMRLTDVLLRAHALLGPIRSAALFARAATFAPGAVQEAEARLVPAGS
jgi:hypothetical protein